MPSSNTKLVLPSAMLMSETELPAKVEAVMVVSVAGSVIEVNFVPLNALLPIDV